MPPRSAPLQSSLPFVKSLKRLRSMPMKNVSDEAERAAAVGRWKQLVDIAPECFQVGRQLLKEVDLLGESDAFGTFTDILAEKATSTLLGRSGPLLKFKEWCFRRGSVPWPLNEALVYQYLCETREAGAAPTAAGAFLSAIAFAVGVVGLDDEELVTSSRRIKGLAFGEFVKKRVLKQRRQLTVDELQFIEGVMMDSEVYLFSLFDWFFFEFFCII